MKPGTYIVLKHFFFFCGLFSQCANDKIQKSLYKLIIETNLPFLCPLGLAVLHFLF